MSDIEKAAAAAAAGAQKMNETLISRGSDFAIAMDLPRVWATGAQAFVNEDFSLLVFREQNILAPQNTDTEMMAALKNVSSIVMPTKILREFIQGLNATLNLTSDGKDANGDTAN
jgi:hypothetical protein